MNVKIGVWHGSENFFKINTWNYRTTVPRFYPENGDCNANIEGSSEGALFPQLITNETVLWYWRKTLCRPVPLHYDSKVQVGKLKAFKFILRDDVYDRFENATADCYKGTDLPDGLSDVSKCFFGMNDVDCCFSSDIHHPQCFLMFSDQPIVASFPHFYSRPLNLSDKLEGLNPDPEKHTSYTIVEPTLGVPLNQRAVSQSNIVTGNLRKFKSDIAKFSDLIIPMFWLEYVRTNKYSTKKASCLPSLPF